ncbi:MAG TPA: diaminopimelate epimerase [Gammaproteobacteria bacterium]|nr:diaminopimelate epimerase [Gammaproteobacteria bacterium]
MTLLFTKMHGLGNDFAVVDAVTNPVKLTPDKIRALADRHFGIGFDQLLLVEPPSQPDVDFNYRIFNVDGGEAEHCGNGARCFARFVWDKGLCSNNPLTVKTQNRILSLRLDDSSNVTVDMEKPILEPAALPFHAEAMQSSYRRTLTLAGTVTTIEFGVVSMGNPHAVIIVEDLDKTAVKDVGEALQQHPDFPKSVNVGFMQILSRDHIRLRVYERGAGETMACGTGACAATVSGCLRGLLGDTVKVDLRGGSLQINWAFSESRESSVLMTGPATTVYEGTIE